jgi:predicted MFS family arabinose efflux permease
MEELYEPIFGLSRAVVMGLPISVEMFFAGISVLSAGAWLDRRGWHEPFLIGLFLAVLGVLYSWLAPDAFHFIASRGVAGLGYGFALMAAQGFVIAYTDDRSKAQGFTQLFAGAYAGSICGGVAGAMLAERFGYGPVFFLGAVILLLVVPYTILFMRSALRRPEHRVAAVRTQPFNMEKILHFVFNKNVLSLILLSIIPAAIAVVGFLNYFSPVYLNRIGVSQSNIGRVLMIYGICLIYIAPFISKYVDLSNNKKNYVVLSGILGGLTFVVFHFFTGIYVTAVAVFLLGLSSAFGFASQSAYLLQLKTTQELGEGKAMGIFTSVEKAGQVLGPLVFGWLILSTQLSQALTYLGMLYLVIVLLFLFLATGENSPHYQ